MKNHVISKHANDAKKNSKRKEKSKDKSNKFSEIKDDFVPRQEKDNEITNQEDSDLANKKVKEIGVKYICKSSTTTESKTKKENDDLEFLNVVTKSADNNIVDTTAVPDNVTDILDNSVKCKLCIHRFTNNHQLVQHMKQNHIQALIHEHMENTKLDGPRIPEEGTENVNQTEVKEESTEQENEFWDNDIDDSDNDPNYIPDNEELETGDETTELGYPKGCVKCAKCNAMFRNKQLLNDHQIKKHGYVAFKCPISTCDAQFTSEMRLKQHIGT